MHYHKKKYRYFGFVKNYKIDFYQIKPSSPDLPTASYLDQPVLILAPDFWRRLLPPGNLLKNIKAYPFYLPPLNIPD